MKRIILLLGYVFFSIYVTQAQDKQKKPVELPAMLIGDDTIPYTYLPEVYVIRHKYKYVSPEQMRRRKLIRDVRIAYPYAVRAAEILVKTEQTIDNLDRRRDERRYIRALDNNLKAEFKDELMDLTTKQGHILMLLLDRQTGHTCHYLLKDLRGGLTAFFWQSVGRLFGYNLKDGYDPAQQHKEIEAIVLSLEQRALLNSP